MQLFNQPHTDHALFRQWKEIKMGMTDMLALSRLETKGTPQISLCNVTTGIWLHLLRIKGRISIQAATPYLTCPVVSRYCRVSNKPVVLCRKCCNKWAQQDDKRAYCQAKLLISLLLWFSSQSPLPETSQHFSLQSIVTALQHFEITLCEG